MMVKKKLKILLCNILLKTAFLLVRNIYLEENEMKNLYEKMETILSIAVV